MIPHRTEPIDALNLFIEHEPIKINECMNNYNIRFVNVFTEKRMQGYTFEIKNNKNVNHKINCIGTRDIERT